MAAENITPQQSIEIIQKMINKARFNFSKGSFYFILWGTLLIGASIFEVVSLNRGLGPAAYFAWPIVGVLGGIVSMIYGFRSSRNEVGGHLERMYAGIWLTYFFTLTVLIIALVVNGLNPSGYILIITGMPTFLSGYLLRFRPLILGGMGFWIFGIVAIFLLPAYATLLFAISIFFGYLVPGILMRKIHSEEDV